MLRILHDDKIPVLPWNMHGTGSPRACHRGFAKTHGQATKTSRIAKASRNVRGYSHGLRVAVVKALQSVAWGVFSQASFK